MVNERLKGEVGVYLNLTWLVCKSVVATFRQGAKTMPADRYSAAGNPATR
jgi:hypothetical protein